MSQEKHFLGISEAIDPANLNGAHSRRHIQGTGGMRSELPFGGPASGRTLRREMLTEIHDDVPTNGFRIGKANRFKSTR